MSWVVVAILSLAAIGGLCLITWLIVMAWLAVIFVRERFAAEDDDPPMGIGA